MASFNFVDAAGKGYKFAWDERSFLTHYGFWPVMLKVATFQIIVLLELEKNLLRQGLLLLPAYFLEGWLVAVAIRFALLGERRPEPLNREAGDQTPEAAARRRCIMAGILVYLLIKLFCSLAGGLVMNLGEVEYTPPKTEPGAGAYFAMVLVLGGVIWLFRFLWLHIPVVMGYPVRRFLKRIAGFATSVYMLGLWMICMMPAVLVVVGAAKILAFMLPGHVEGVPSLAYICVLTALQAVVETIVIVITNVAMACGLRQVLIADENSRY